MEQVGIGFVGAGWMGATLLGRLAEREDTAIRALLEPDRDRGTAVLAELGLPADLLVDDFEQITGDPAVDAVFLVSPNRFHGPQAVAALAAGKHVFCEKPCATAYDEYRREIELDRANPDLVTYVDYILHFDPMEIRLREMVERGELGTVTQVQVNYRHPVNIAGDKAWKLKRDLLGDAVGMGVIHALFAMTRIFAPQAAPAAVYATSMATDTRGFETDPVWNIMVAFDNGATGFCFGDIDNGIGYDAYHNVFGTGGGFVFDPGLETPHKVRYWSAEATGGEWVRPLDPDRCAAQGRPELAWPPGAATPDSGDVMDHQTRECTAHFIECVRSGTESPLGFAAAAGIAEIGWAALMSAGTGRRVTLPLDPDVAADFFAGGC